MNKGDCVNLWGASAKFHFFTNVEIANLGRGAQKLLECVLLGKEMEALAIMKISPELLLIKSKVIDYSGRIIIATPFQAAIGNGDKHIWKMMLEYIDPRKALGQFQEWFPRKVQSPSAQELQAYQTYYSNIALAIINDADLGKAAIEKFRQEITSQKVITQGLHFDLYQLMAAYQVFKIYFDTFDTRSTHSDLFWNQVVGYVQRQMTAFDAQVHCSGIHGVLENENNFTRKLTIQRDTMEFFPLKNGVDLGFDFACYSNQAGGWLHYQIVPRAISFLKEYMEKKQMHLQDLERELIEECSRIPSNSF